MRKLIDIPEDIYKKLQHICIDEGTNPKNWIENLVVNEVKKKSKKRGQT
jgi:hypothetical protein